MSHTIETVKRDLPKVKLQFGKTIVEANVAGRLNEFASVWTRDNQAGWEFSWPSVVRAINNDTPLRII